MDRERRGSARPLVTRAPQRRGRRRLQSGAPASPQLNRRQAPASTSASAVCDRSPDPAVSHSRSDISVLVRGRPCRPVLWVSGCGARARRLERGGVATTELSSQERPAPIRRRRRAAPLCPAPLRTPASRAQTAVKAGYPKQRRPGDRRGDRRADVEAATGQGPFRLRRGAGEAIKERMPELAAQHPGPHRPLARPVATDRASLGSDPKLADPLLRNVLTTSAYGCPLGPTQAARHIRGMSAHELGATANPTSASTS